MSFWLLTAGLAALAGAHLDQRGSVALGLAADVHLGQNDLVLPNRGVG